MSNLNGDILYSIFEEMQDDGNSLYSLSLVNITWCKIVIPILWKNPWKYLIKWKERSLLNVIISHLSNETRNILNPSTKYKKPLFDYIGFCKHLELNDLERIIDNTIKCKKPTVIDEIFKLFINESARITHLYLPRLFNHQIHLIPGAEKCLSELEFLRCCTLTEGNVLIGLTKICKSIKELCFTNKLGEQRNYYPYQHLSDYNNHNHNNEIVGLIQCQKNLKSLEIDGEITWSHVGNLSLSSLQNLKVRNIPTNCLISLFKSSKGLTEIKVEYSTYRERTSGNTNRSYRSIIQAVCKNCPNVKYLGIPFNNECSLELEKLLITCQYLEGLYLVIEEEDCNNLFGILTRSSPSNLYRFKFQFSLTLATNNFRIPRVPINPWTIPTTGNNPTIPTTRNNPTIPTTTIPTFTTNWTTPTRNNPTIPTTTIPTFTTNWTTPTRNNPTIPTTIPTFTTNWATPTNWTIPTWNNPTISTNNPTIPIIRNNPTIPRIRNNPTISRIRNNMIPIKRITLDSLKSFFHHWKGRHPMLLQTIGMSLSESDEHSCIIENYKFLDVVKKYDDVNISTSFKDFEWTEPMSFHKTSIEDNDNPIIMW